MVTLYQGPLDWASLSQTITLALVEGFPINREMYWLLVVVDVA